VGLDALGATLSNHRYLGQDLVVGAASARSDCKLRPADERWASEL